MGSSKESVNRQLEARQAVGLREAHTGGQKEYSELQYDLEIQADNDVSSSVGA